MSRRARPKPKNSRCKWKRQFKRDALKAFRMALVRGADYGFTGASWSYPNEDLLRVAAEYAATICESRAVCRFRRDALISIAELGGEPALREFMVAVSIRDMRAEGVL